MAEFVVGGDAEGLEGPGRGMDAAGAVGGAGDGDDARDDVGEFVGAESWGIGGAVGTGGDDGAGDFGGEAFFAKLGNDAGEFCFAGGGDEGGGRDAGGGVEAHVERGGA